MSGNNPSMNVIAAGAPFIDDAGNACRVVLLDFIPDANTGVSGFVVATQIWTTAGTTNYRHLDSFFADKSVPIMLAYKEACARFGERSAAAATNRLQRETLSLDALGMFVAAGWR